MATEIKEIVNGYPARWTFGRPTLAAANNGRARWIRGSTSPLDQKAPTGWLADLYGGAQTGDDWARLSIPVNELPVTEFNRAQWSWYQTATESMGVNIVIWMHDPDDNDKRAEVTQVGGISGLDKSAGWNSHEFVTTTTQMFFYGEGTTGTGLTAGTQYTWDQFRTDTLFDGWTIYRITLEWGWEASGTFESAYIAEVKLNGTVIMLEPVTVKHIKTVLTSKTVVDGAHSADDVVCEDADNGEGTEWDWDVGGTGKIVKAVAACAKNAIVPVLEIQLYTAPPTCELDDNAAATGPVAADVPNFVGIITMPAMTDTGTGHSFSVATPSLATGNLPLYFDAPLLYGVVMDKTGADFDASLLSIILTAEMDD